MSNIYQMNIIRKNNQTFTSISEAPIQEVYAMLYGAIELVSNNTNQSVKSTLDILASLDEYAKSHS